MLGLELSIWIWFLFGVVAVLGLLVLGLLFEVRGLRRVVRSTAADAAMRAIDSQRAAMDALQQKADAHDQRLADLAATLATCVQRVGVVRYDAYQDVGGQLSFSVALLDGRSDGVVVSVLNGREGARGYAKAIVAGDPAVTLSEDEARALAQAKGT